MTVFLAALALIVLFAGSGHRLGAIRGVISLVGIVVGAMLAFPLAPKVAPLFSMAGSKNVLWNMALPPVSVFIVVQVAFFVVAFLVHRRVEWRYKYKATDELRHCWERLNSRLGVCLGVVAACAYLLLLGTVCQAAGYLTYQIASADPGKEVPVVRHLNEIRDDLRATGLDRALVAIDPMPHGFYATADLIGLLYHNPPLQAKLGEYPALLALAERPEFVELGRDPQFNEMLLTQPGIGTILAHPKVQEILANAELMQAIYKLQPADLLKFVQTGKSDVFASEPILGKWEIEVAATFATAYRRNPKMSVPESRNLMFELDVIKGLAVLVLPENKLILRGPNLKNDGSWTRSGNEYTATIAGPSITAGRPGGALDQLALIDGQLHFRSSADGFSLVFNRPD